MGSLSACGRTVCVLDREDRRGVHSDMVDLLLVG